MIISAGFDAAQGDPLVILTIHLYLYKVLNQNVSELVEWANWPSFQKPQILQELQMYRILPQDI